MKTRSVEMYVGIYQGNARTWFTHFVDVPRDTPEDKLSEVAQAAMFKELEKNPNLMVAFVGIYNDSDDTIEEAEQRRREWTEDDLN